MPRNRADVDRETKRDEIVVTATRLFTTGGFESTSMAALARAAGVAPNTVYWYFADKDAVLIAVLTRVLERALPSAAGADDQPLADVLLAVAERFDAIDRLIAAVHARAEVSPSVRQWHDAFHAGADAWLLDRIREHLARTSDARVPPDDVLAPIPRIWSFAIEGMVAHRVSAEDRRSLCESLVQQLAALQTRS